MSLSIDDRKRIQKYYTDAFDLYGPEDAKGVHWLDRDSQNIRLRVLLNIADLSGKSILDVGCGTGELFALLQKNNIKANYTGIDIVPEFITAAKKRFPEIENVFQEKDIFDVTESYDYILASGALSFKVKENLKFYKSMIQKMWSSVKVALAFNMLNRDIHADDETYAAYNPKEIADFCGKLGAKVEVITDYLPQDFTIVMRR